MCLLRAWIDLTSLGEVEENKIETQFIHKMHLETVP